MPVSARSYADESSPIREPGGPARYAREADRPAGRSRPDASGKLSDRRGPFRPERLAPTRTRLSGAGISRSVRGLDCAILALVAVTAFVVAHPAGVLNAPVKHALDLGAAALIAAAGLKAAGAYGFGPNESLPAHSMKTVAGFVAVSVLQMACMLLMGRPRAFGLAIGACSLVSFALVFAAHMTWWTLVRRWRREGLLTPNIIIIGATKNAEKLIQRLLETREAAVLGVFDDRLDRAPDAICRVPVLGTTQALFGHRVMPYVDRVVITVPASAQGRVRQLIEQLRVLPNDVSLFLDFDGAKGATRTVSQLASAPLAQVSGHARDDDRIFWKRVQDLVLGSAIFVIALPVMLVVAAAVKLDSPGPVLFRQRRHGFNNEEIVVWKFRSMRQEAADATASRQVTAGDDRITRVGRFIRGTSLDELPQILNVLKGEMSLVGPRPHAIGMKTGETESARLVAEYAHRHRMKPGITGWAAINGSRGPVDTPKQVRRRVELDVEYIERQSFWLDLYIMMMTLPCLLGDRSSVR